MDFAKLLAKLDGISTTKQSLTESAEPDKKVDEEDTQEGNEFSGELAKAKAAGKKEFEVDGKKYPVKEDEEADDKDTDDADKDTKDNESVDLEECYSQAMMGGGEPEQESGMNINASTDTRTGHKSLTVTAQGQAAEQLAQILKLSGMNPQAAHHDAEMEEAYANEPAPETQGIDVQIAQGNDLNRPKNSYPKVAGGDNPMAMREARELAAIEQRLNEELAAFKVVAEGKGKPDFLDMDKDGNKKEPMKKALADKKKGAVKESINDEQAGFYIVDDDGNSVSGPYASKQEAYEKAMQMAPGRNSGMYDVKYKGDVITLDSLIRNIIKILPPDVTSDDITDPMDIEHHLRRSPLGQVFAKLSPQQQADVTDEVANYLYDKFDESKDQGKKVNKADVVAEKAVSQQQQKFMGMVHAMQKGAKVKGASPELKKAAKSMSKADARDFAKTKHKGLPAKKT
jgi:hypothetical protein